MLKYSYILMKGEHMINGVTKSINAQTPRNSCFEKEIVILNSGCDIPDHAEIERQTALLTSTAPEFLRRSQQLNRLKMAAFAAAGAFSTALLFALLYMFV